MTFPEILATYITIDDDIRSFLNTQTEKISVKKGTVISDQNTLNRKVYFVEKGLLRSFYFEKGKEHFLPGLIEEKKKFSWAKMVESILHV